MPVVPGLTTTVPEATPFYRITSLSFRTSRAALHKRVVNGEGGVRSRHGARYNHPGSRTAYLAEDLETCLAERMFYFHREILVALDSSHITGVLPPFQQRFILWEVQLQNPVQDVFELSVANASAMQVFPTLMLNPSQDYHHLKDRRAVIQSNGYNGLRAPSTRVRGTGHMIVLFHDQSRNLQSITPFEVEFRLMTFGLPPAPFVNHAIDILDFLGGEARILSPSGGGLPPALAAYQNWTRVEFNH